MVNTDEIIDKNTWGALPHTQWQHTWEFGEVQKSNGRSVLRMIIECDDEIVGYAQAIAYDLRGDKTIVYCPYGPVWIVEPQSSWWSACSGGLREYAISQNAIAIRVESGTQPDQYKALPRYMYHASFHAPRGEMMLDITKPLDVLGERFHKKTAYNLRKAARNGLFTKIYSGSEMMNHVDTFIDLNKSNMASHGTTTHTDSYFKTLFKTLSDNPRNFVIVTYSGLEEIQAINLFVVWGSPNDSHCHCPYGASTPEGKKSGAYYFIKNEAIKHLQTISVKTFNWGGISVGIEDASLMGLNQFKLGFGGDPVTHKSFYDIVINRIWYTLYQIRSYVKRK